jgi:hypothetical protein
MRRGLSNARRRLLQLRDARTETAVRVPGRARTLTARAQLPMQNRDA